MKKYSKSQIFTIPNLMSCLRLVLIPVFCWMYLTAETERDILWAGGVVLISSLTDMLDGWVARTFHMITDIGKVLDPVADKLTHAALAVCLALRHPLMWALIVLMAVKEGYMGLKGLKLMKQGRMLDGAMWFGKVCTALLFVGLLVLFLFPQLPAGAANAMIVVMMAVMTFTLYKYVVMFRKVERGESEDGVKKL